MVAFNRYARDDDRDSFDFPSLASGKETDQLIAEIGIKASTVGDKHGNPHPARMHMVRFIRDDGSQGDRVGGVSVPRDISDEFAAELISHGHSVN